MFSCENVKKGEDLSADNSQFSNTFDLPVMNKLLSSVLMAGLADRVVTIADASTADVTAVHVGVASPRHRQQS